MLKVLPTRSKGNYCVTCKSAREFIDGIRRNKRGKSRFFIYLLKKIISEGELVVNYYRVLFVIRLGFEPRTNSLKGYCSTVELPDPSLGKTLRFPPNFFPIQCFDYSKFAAFLVL